MLTATRTTTLETGTVKALRNADRVSFHHFDGQSRIIATKVTTDRKGHETETETVILTDFKWANHGDGPHRADEAIDKFSCFEMIHTAQYHDEWLTITKLVKPGDILSLAWMRNNNTQSQESAGFVTDELSLVIHRGETKLTFLIRSQTGPDNMARMIRRGI